MGFGGELMWSSVAREIHERTGRQVVPCRFVDDKFYVIESEIFRNNPRFVFDSSGIPLVLNNPNTNYCKQDTPTRAIHRYDRHVIEQICEAYGIPDPKLKCELFFTEAEYNRVDELERLIGGPFVVIEPNVKNEYGVNKEYSFGKWQLVANELLSNSIKLVQTGQPGVKVLDGVIDLTGCLTFREAALLVSRSRLLVASEGGLMHAANAVGTRAVILVTGFIHPTMTCYPENTNIWIGAEHGPCGMKTQCLKCLAEVQAHDWREISTAVLQRLL